VARRGEHVHAEPLRARIRDRRPDVLVVVDMGSRGGPILSGVPTLVVDHHQPRGLPPGATVVTAFGHAPVAPASLLTHHLARGVADVEPLAWLALLGTVADAGTDAPFTELPGWLARYGRRATTEAVALLNAARRAADDAVEIALQVLLQAGSPRDIAGGAAPAIARLRAVRRQVQAEVQRCARTAPRLADGVALIRFSSPMQVHPLVATRWATRLRDRVVVAANDGYLPGRVNFAMRTATRRNLVDLLRGLPLGRVEGELGFGHPAATGGSLVPADFDRLLRALGVA
jgi:single-stranded DNA-specific DHH superfamily exonuclease